MVQLNGCAQGFCLLTIVLSFLAFLLDDVILFFCAAAILAGLLLQLAAFDARVRSAVTSVAVSRSAERTQVRKGTVLRMETEITLAVPDHLQVSIAEEIPAGVLVQDGETGGALSPRDGSASLHLSYRVIPAVHGNVRFPGLTLSASDPFYATRIRLADAPFAGPVLRVQPRGVFEPAAKRVTAESREIEKIGALTGFGIRAIRDYLSGDDLRRIDWKLSAKHNKLLVREYTGVISLPPLIIADLPWRDAPYNAADLDRMVASITGLAGTSARMFQSASVLVISGPNIIRWLHEEKELERCMSLFREWLHPAARAEHLYRFSDRGDLRGRLRRAERAASEITDPAVTASLAALRRAWLHAIAAQSPLAFAGQVARTLRSTATDEVYLFSLAQGDASHLRQVIRIAQGLSLRVHLRLPAAADAARIGPLASRLSSGTMEAFA